MSAVAAHDQDRVAYLRGETKLSIVINAVLSLVFFLIVFGLAPVVPISGIGNYAFDFVPQSFMIALMSLLVPGAITASRIGKGRIAGVGERPARLMLRSLATALVAALAAAALAVLLPLVFGSGALALLPAVAGKMLYGAALAAIVTPIGLRQALRTSALGE